MGDISLRRRLAIQIASEIEGVTVDFNELPAESQMGYDAAAVRMMNAIASHHEVHVVESDSGPYLLLPMWTR